MHFPLKSSRSHSAPGAPCGERAVLRVAFVAVRALGAQARFLPAGGVGTVASSTVRWCPGINRPGRWTHTGLRSAQGKLACKMQGCGGGCRLCHLLCQQPPSLLGGFRVPTSGVEPPAWTRPAAPSDSLATGWFTDTAQPEPRGECPAETCCWHEGSWVAPHP